MYHECFSATFSESLAHTEGTVKAEKGEYLYLIYFHNLTKSQTKHGEIATATMYHPI